MFKIEVLALVLLLVSFSRQGSLLILCFYVCHDEL
jgi:hypothetical protein